MKKHLLTATILSAALPAFAQTIARQPLSTPTLAPISSPTSSIIRDPSLNTDIISTPILSSDDMTSNEPSGPSIPTTTLPTTDIGRLPENDAPIFINPSVPGTDGSAGNGTLNDDRNWGDFLTFPEWDDDIPDFGEDGGETPDDGQDSDNTPDFGEDGEDAPDDRQEGEDGPDFGEDGEDGEDVPNDRQDGEDGGDGPDFGEDGERIPEYGEDGEDGPDFGEDGPDFGEDGIDRPTETHEPNDDPTDQELVIPSFNQSGCDERTSYGNFLKDDDLDSLLGSDWLRLEFNDCDGIYEFDKRRSPVYNIRYSERACGRASFSKSTECYGWAQAMMSSAKDSFYLAILRSGQAKACHQSVDETKRAPWEVVSNQSKCLSFTKDGLIVESRSGDIVGVYTQEQ